MIKIAASRPAALSLVTLLLFVFSLVCLTAAFHTALASLAGAWGAKEYSHGYFIPVLALLIGWHRLAERKPPVAPSWAGPWVLAGAGALLLMGQLSAFEPPTYYAFVVALVGLGLSVCGRSAMMTLAPAFAYLLFAIPLPRLIYVALSADFQLMSSHMGSAFLDMLGIPVYQAGNIIDLGDFKLQVEEACDGLRYLFPLMSFGFLVGFLIDGAMWKRVAIFLSSIPIAIFMNALRIAMIGVAVHVWGIGMARGFQHTFEGWAVFMLCILLMLGESRLLMWGGDFFRYHYFGPAQGPFFSGSFTAKPPVWAAAAVALAMACLFTNGIASTAPDIVPFHPPLASFPMHIGAWQGQPRHLSDAELDALHLDDYVMADYTRAGKNGESGTPVNFYIAWYDNQHTKNAAHSPSNCIPGSGWLVKASGTKTVATPQGTLRVARLVIQRGDDTRLVYYWFDERGRDMVSQYSAKWFLFWDALTLHRTDGAAVRVVTPVTSNNPAAADARLAAFLSAVYPDMGVFVPGK
ncbi:MAG: VPLPA-CTERM-specific exosortase XrtD [Alphaproteobacteria bacterium]|nr:VPLPA-CTERM-specific exosortase XrtD [Alphaproteobacteria bacterium]